MHFVSFRSLPFCLTTHIIREYRISYLILELKASRESAWTHITSRKHNIKKVFAGSVASPGADVMMLGQLDLQLSVGTELTMDFTARIVVDDAVSMRPKIKLCQVWAVCAPFYLFHSKFAEIYALDSLRIYLLIPG
jgi:hypothetical protein